MIAERGESAVRLRDLTEAAGTNLAAVHYHFGGLGALLTAAATEAVERIIDAQIAELDVLPAGATLVTDTEALVVSVQNAPTAEQVEAETEQAEADAGVERDQPQTPED